MFAEGQQKFTNYIQQFFLTLFHYKEAWDFIREHRIWRGLRKYGWLVRFMIFVAIAFGFHMFSSIYDWYHQVSSSEGEVTFQAGMSSFFDKVAVENFKWAFDGSAKYLILILLEVVVFHFTRKTLEIKTGIKRNANFNAFIKAEMRMIKVAIYCFVLEKMSFIAIAIVTALLPYENFLEQMLQFTASCFFLGFAIMDNYNEIFGLKIRESFKATLPMFGIALAVGMITYILIYIPVVGAIAGTILGAVVATIILEENEELIPEIMAIRKRDETGVNMEAKVIEAGE
jgi:hypothetical protein